MTDHLERARIARSIKARLLGERPAARPDRQPMRQQSARRAGPAGAQRRAHTATALKAPALAVAGAFQGT